MDAEDRERQLDEWLDDALSRYSDVEPHAGLEQRILANLEAQRQARPPWLWWVLAPVAAAVVVISVGGLWMARSRPQPVRTAPTTNAEVKPPAQTKAPPVVTPVARAVSERPVRRHMGGPPPMQVAMSRQDRPPRQPVFPSPSPLSPQEIAAMRLAQQNPAEALIVAEAQEAERARMKSTEQDSGRYRK